MLHKIQKFSMNNSYIFLPTQFFFASQIVIKEIFKMPNYFQDSQLECTIPSDGGKKVNRKLLFNANEMGHKRNRISSDSDSDVEVVSRRKKNRFINIDLSVEFESDTRQLDLKKSQHLTCSSNNVDYEVSFLHLNKYFR